MKIISQVSRTILLKILYKLLLFLRLIGCNFLIVWIFTKFFEKNLGTDLFNPSKKSVLILNHFRFKHDLTTIVRYEDFNYLYLNTRWQHIFCSIFFGIRLPLAEEYLKPLSNKIVFCNEILEEILNELTHKYQISNFLSCSFTYKQDYPFAYYCLNSNKVTFNILFKEYLKDECISYETIVRYKKSGYKSIADKIFLANKGIEHILLESNVINAEQSRVIGSPRFDDIFNHSTNDITTGRQTVTLFSFMHCSGLVQLKDEKHFTDNSQEGFYNLFYNVHKVIGSLAIKYSDVDFIIKCKYENHWFDEIEKVFLSAFGRETHSFRNIKLDASTSSHELIQISNTIISFNSTTLLESLAFKKMPIVPIFDEAKTKYSETNVFFKKYFSLLEIANSEEELVSKIEKNMEVKPIILNMGKFRNLFEEFIYRYDGLSTKRLIEELGYEKN